MTGVDAALPTRRASSLAIFVGSDWSDWLEELEEKCTSISSDIGAETLVSGSFYIVQVSFLRSSILHRPYSGGKQQHSGCTTIHGKAMIGGFQFWRCTVVNEKM